MNPDYDIEEVDDIRTWNNQEEQLCSTKIEKVYECHFLLTKARWVTINNKRKKIPTSNIIEKKKEYIIARNKNLCENILFTKYRKYILYDVKIIEY